MLVQEAGQAGTRTGINPDMGYGIGGLLVLILVILLIIYLVRRV